MPGIIRGHDRADAMNSRTWDRAYSPKPANLALGVADAKRRFAVRERHEIACRKMRRNSIGSANHGHSNLLIWISAIDGESPRVTMRTIEFTLSIQK
jgi:hypothetical protein